jgi:hypothetical protein
LASEFIGLTAGEANALVVNVGGQNYDVTIFTGTYNGNTSKFETAANGGAMPWWGNQQAAVDFAAAVNIGLGMPNPGTRGGYLADAIDSNLLFLSTTFYFPLFSGTITSSEYAGSPASYIFAVAALVAPSSAPSPLPIFGAAAAFGASRQLRKRIKRSGHSLPSTYGL